MVRGRFAFKVSNRVLKSECRCDVEEEQASAALRCKLSALSLNEQACKHVPVYGSLKDVEQSSAGNLSLRKSSVRLNLLWAYWKKFAAHMLTTAGVSYLHLLLADSRLFAEQQEKRNSQQPKIHTSE